MREKTWYRKIYDFLIEYWFVSAFISTAPAWWFTFVEIFGGNFGFIVDGKLTPSALKVFEPLFVISFLFTLLMSLADRYNERAKKAGQNILNIMLESVNAIKHAKLRRFTRYIDANHNQQNLNPFFDITQPQTQIESVLENIRIALSQIFDIGRDDISLSIIYKTDKNPNWKWLSTMNIETDLELQELTTNPYTSVKQIIDGHADLIFFPDKRVGVQQNQYVGGRKDQSHGGRGSVLCKDISLETNTKCIQAILSVATYGLQLCKTNDADAIHKITGILLPSFERRIQLELALLYIKEVMTSPKTNNRYFVVQKRKARKTSGM